MVHYRTFLLLFAMVTNHTKSFSCKYIPGVALSMESILKVYVFGFKLFGKAVTESSTQKECSLFHVYPLAVCK